ncbi:MAG: regulator [Comamonadaceae bacterium]|nr:MAG: regulator [Comamonadaceae bacterium]
MPLTFEARSMLTDRYQTTIPESIRLALRLSKGDKIRYTVSPAGEVVLTRAGSAATEEPALGTLLGFLAQDVAARTECLQGVDASLVQCVNELVAGIAVNLDEPLSADDE